MNVAVIILAILILLFILYFVYVRFFQNKMIVSSGHLTESVSSIKMGSLTNPTSNNYSYSIWIYVNKPSASDSVIFTAQNGSTKLLALNLNNTTLTADVAYGDMSITKNYTLTKNFSLQSWEHVILSFTQPNVFDFYLNGKLLLSYTLPGNVAYFKTIDSNSQITFGNNDKTKPNLDANISNFEFLPSAMVPATAWNKYLNGNGYSFLPNYGMYVSLIKDQKVSKDYTIF